MDNPAAPQSRLTQLLANLQPINTAIAQTDQQLADASGDFVENVQMYKWYKYESIQSPIEWRGYIYKNGWLIYTGDDILITVGTPEENPEHIIDDLWRD